jgi:N-acetylneuraminate synthase
MGEIITVGEIGINHNGSLATAKDLIKMCHICGVDYVKFQKRCIDECYTKEELKSPRESKWGCTFREQKEGLELSREAYVEIDDYCRCLDIPWFASPWDVTSVKFLDEFDVPFIKIPSALVTWDGYLEAVRETGRPVVMSTGMSTKKEVDRALSIVGKNIYCIMHTTSSYPTPIDDLNVRKIETLKELYGKKAKIGYSNHFPSLMSTIYAVALGAEMVEFHITYDRAAIGSDHSSAMEKRNVESIVDWCKAAPRIMGSGEWKVFDSELPIRTKLRKH